MNLKSEIFLLVLTVWCISSSRAQETSNCDGFNTIIDIVSNVTDCQKDPSTPNRWQCHSLEAAFAIHPKKPLTDTCVNITEDANHHFTNAIVSNARKLKITSHDMFTFQCGSNPGQFLSFIYGDNIEIENLKFDGPCGGAQTSTYIHNDPFYMNSKTLLSVDITAVFHFENVTDITLNSIDMNSYDGYGISMTDCIGHISLTKSTLQSNRPVYFQFEKSSKGTIYGGGVLFRHISRKTLKGAFFTISDTNLKNLTGYPDETAPEKESKPYEPFGYGGAISLSFHKTSGNKINIINDDINDDTWITHNKALYGGAIYVKHGSDSSNNSILVKEIFCTHNTAVFSGGAFFYFTVEYSHTNDNSFTVDNLNELSSNTALNGYGGAFCQRKQQSTGIHRSQFDPSLVKTFFYGGKKSQISHNNAKIGSALFFDNVYVQFFGEVGLIDNSCTASKDGTLGFGAIYAYQSHLLVTSTSSEDAFYLFQNHATGIVLDFSDLHLRGNLDLYSNKGINGGGMALHGRSQIIIESTTAFLDIDSNNANKGAGISVDFNGPLIGEWETYLTPVYPCFFKFMEQAVNGRKPRVRFNNNKAVLFSGHENDIFTTSLRTCSSSSESADLLDFFNDKDKFNFTSKNSIATEPVEIYIPDNKVWQNMYPGTTMTVPIELRDEIGQPVSATVNMDIISKTEGVQVEEKNNYKAFIVSNNSIELTLKISHKPALFDLVFSLENANAAQPKQKRGRFDHCPFVKVLEDGVCQCNPKTNEARGIVLCIGDDIYTYANLWFKPTHQEIVNDLEKGIQCPNHYCRLCDREDENWVYCKYDPNKTQCGKNRDENSTLCSSCKNGTTLQWGSEKCLPVDECGVDKLSLAFTIIGLYVADLIFVLIVLLSNIDVYTCYLNSVFFFYQVIGNFLTTTQLSMNDSYIGPLIAFLIEVMNFDGIGSNKGIACLGEHFTDFYKPMLNLAVLLVTFVNLFICVCFCSYLRGRLLSKKNIPVENVDENGDQQPQSIKTRTFLNVFKRENGYRAAVFIILYTYGSIVKVCFDALKFVNIDDQFRLFNYAEFKQKSDWFWPYYIIASLLLIMFSMYPFVIDDRFYRKMKRYRSCCDCLDKCSCRSIKKVFANRHVTDVFKEPFRDDCTGFAVYYLVIRIVIDLISMFLVAFNPHKQLSLVILTVLSIGILVIFAANKPYKDEIDGQKMYLNGFDTFILFLICAIGIISNGKQKMSVLKMNDNSSPNFVFGVLVQILLLVPGVVVVGYNLLRLLKFGVWIVVMKMRTKKGWFIFFDEYMKGDHVFPKNFCDFNFIFND